MLLLGASLALVSPSAFAAGTSADGGTVTGGSGGSASSSNSNGGQAGDGGHGGRGGEGGDYTETTAPSSSALGTGLLGSTTPGSSTGTYYANCDQVFAAGLSDIPRGSAGYRPALDRDSDGYACDTRTGLGGQQ